MSEPVLCTLCRGPIAGDPIHVHHPAENAGPYHQECGRTTLSLLHAMAMLGKPFG